MKKLLLLILIIGLLSCNPKPSDYQQLVFNVWGTECIVIYKNKTNINVLADIEGLFNALTKSISTYDSMSLLSAINSNKTLVLDSHIYNLLELSKTVFETSSGIFDPTVEPLVKAWGFLKQEGKWMDTSKIPKMLTYVGLEKWSWNKDSITFKPKNAAIDFNAIAPGYAADLIARYFENKGINHFFINNGGEIVLKGTRPDGTDWQVAVNRPVKANNIQDTVYKISNVSMATSGNYNNSFSYKGLNYGHTISAKTGLPQQTDMQSATVFAENAALADAYATVCMGLNSTNAIAFLTLNKLKGYLIFKDSSGVLKRKALP